LAPKPRPERIFFHNVWFRDSHNNVRYDALLPRLPRVDPYLSFCSGGRLRRGIEFRALRLTERYRHRAVLAQASRRYRFAFCTAPGQIPAFTGRIVVDLDDPRFDAEEAALLRYPQVAACVVTTESARCRLESLGVNKPIHVVPQPVRVDLIDARRVTEIGKTRAGSFVAGFVAAWLLTRADHGGANPLYNIDHLLVLWERIHARLPDAKLWLIGHASSRVVKRCSGRSDILVAGRLPPGEALAHVANFDVGLYPRTTDQGVQSIKVSEYMSLGVPTVAYDYEVTRLVRDKSAGILVDSPEEFVAAVVRLANDSSERVMLGESARVAGRSFDVRDVARRYEHDVIDAYLS
jgi:glycosyltransferase involved in cell wall biosynthesis